MAKLLFSMHGVSEDEIQEVRELVQGLECETYETDAGRWGIGIAAIWLRDDEQYPTARTALDAYQQARYQGAEKERLYLQKLTVLQGLYIKFRQDPQKFALTVLGLAAVIGLTVYPFLNL
jgi:hypothetical protein